MSNKTSRSTKSGRTVSTNKKTPLTKSSQPRLDPFFKKHATKYPESAWIVFVTPDGRDGKRVKPRVVDGTLTRDQARGAYAILMGVKKEDTRSRRLSNY